MAKARSKKKAKKVLKRKVKKTTKKKARKAVKKVRKAKKVTKKKAKKAKKTKNVSKAKKALIRKTAEKVIGKVTHYYDRIGVAVVALEENLKIGDTIRLKRGRIEFTQKALSIQKDHMPLSMAEKGQEVGLKVDKVIDEGTLLLRA
ncbi:MAG: hypothetical protein PHE68_00710 [Candidatus Peribacteraceae bacterium]|nr:hypothetical protein [Candidatus Peribacteraceae bacterium]